jgi:citrate lyase subunit beta / citryl-CoA lyase
MNLPFRPRRSVLYIPGSNARALEKARSLDADCLILDLEDSVGPDAKEVAREMVRDVVVGGGFGHRETIIRINALDTPWGEEDMLAAIAARPDAILAPKVSTQAELSALRAVFSAADVGGAIMLWIMIETPLAILNAGLLAGAAADADAPLAGLVMGTNDLAKETGAGLGSGRAAMLPWLMTAVVAARANGLAILDGVYNNIADLEGFRAECRQGRELGMDGKTIIHPNQIAGANEIFAPASADVIWANKIIAAFEKPENKGRGVISLEGRMVERLHAEMARRTVAMAAAIAARERAE